MARSFHKRERMTALSEINVTPMIDMAFALLIIFMITTPLLEQSIQVDLPIESATRTPAAPESKFQTISIDKDGIYYWSQEQVTLEELENRIKLMAQQNGPPVVHLRGDFSLQYQKIIEVMDLVKQSNLTKISLDTRVK
ncbi:MAG: biopolymer transporter ExbD [Opitutales bacterium]|jgi:biopolymer transport protein ExbD|nr:biopolymer transporter ExbD [bacterium]MDG2166697.1 biopolymer transporter ExbD [Opitutales bacterium]